MKIKSKSIILLLRKHKLRKGHPTELRQNRDKVSGLLFLCSPGLHVYLLIH